MSTEVQFNLYDFSEETLDFLYNLPTEFPPSAHTHVVADITDLPDLVDGTGSISVFSIETNGLTVQEDATINGILNADDIQGNLTGNVYVSVQAGQNLLKGDPVYISGTYTSGSISLPIVSRADSSNPAKMPAAGIMDADLNTGINGSMVISGRIANFNTNNYNLNAELYVASGGGFTTTAPTLLPQPIARVSRKDTNYGSIIVKVDGIAGVGPEGPPGSGVAGNHDVGVIYLKNNATATTIPIVNGRAVVAGTMQTGTLFNFEKDATTNSLKYTGDGGRFHVVATFNFYSGSNDTCGFYIGKNTVPASALDPNADRISESEVYAEARNQTKPASAAVQTVLDLNPGDRIFFIVQNKDSTASIKVEFLKFVAVTLTSEKGDVGPEGPPAPYVDPVRTTVTGNGSTSVYAISGATGLTNPSALIVAIDGALQEPSVDYTVSGGNITFTSPLANGSKAVVVSPLNTIQVGQVTPSDGSVTSAKIIGGVALSDPIINNSLALNATIYTYGAGAVEAHKTALGLNSAASLTNTDLERSINANSLNFMPPVTFFDDMDGKMAWTTSNLGAGGTGPTDFDNFGSRTHGVYGLRTVATAAAGRSMFARIVTSAGYVAGARFRSCFAISDVTNCNFFLGFSWVGAGNVGLLYRSAFNSGQFTFVRAMNADYTGGTVYPFTTEVPQAGAFTSGKRYIVDLTMETLTSCRIKLYIADFNLSNWTEISNAVVTLPSTSVNVAPTFSVQTLAAEIKTLWVDWVSVEQPNFIR